MMKQTGRIQRTKRLGGKPTNTIVLKILIAVISCLILWDVAGPMGLWARGRLLEERKALYAANMQMAMQNAELEKEIERLKNDHQYQAHMVRSNLGWVRDNEILFRFVNEEKSGQ